MEESEEEQVEADCSDEVRGVLREVVGGRGGQSRINEGEVDVEDEGDERDGECGQDRSNRSQDDLRAAEAKREDA